MNKAFFRLLFTGIAFASALQLFAQDAYRTRATGRTAEWTEVSTWERFDMNKKAWVPASRIPGAKDGMITIEDGDSIILSGKKSARISIDQLIISTNAALVVTDNTHGAIVLNDGEGDDIIVRGRMYIDVNGILHGDGKIQVAETGVFSLRNNGSLTAAVSNNGTVYLGATNQAAGVLSGSNFVNNKTCIWSGGQLILDSATVFTNNGIFTISAAASDLICLGNKKYPARIVNKGSIVSTGKDYAIDFRVRIDNLGVISGVGTYLFSGEGNSGGIISPGASPGHLTLGPGIPKSPVINLEISTNGAVPGVNHDQLTIPQLADLSGGIINITNTATDPVNTEYILINTPEGRLDRWRAVTGVKINTPSNFTAFFRDNSLVVKKTAMEPLEVSWGGFSAFAEGTNGMLIWNTTADLHTSHFLLEYSTDGKTYSQIARVDAKQEEGNEVSYSYTYNGLDILQTNYFRVRQVNADGKTGCSVPRTIRFDKGIVKAFDIEIDQENDELFLNIQSKNVRFVLSDIDGKGLHEILLQPGQHTVYTDALSKGAYRISLFVKDAMVETKQFVKR